MKFNPLISVIIPLYNAEKYILETLNSVRNQTYDNIELIIVDNASTDTGISLVRQFIEAHSGGNIKLIECGVNSGGPAQPRNIGIRAAQGEYIAFLDADDLWHAEKLERQVSLMVNKSLNFTSTLSFLIDENSSPVANSRRVIDGKVKEYGVKKLLFSNSIVTSSVIVKSEFIGESRFDESANLVTVEDYLLWLSLMGRAECRFAQLLDTLVDYRVLSQSLGNKSGKLAFASKGMFAGLQFVIENKKHIYLPIILLSNIFRLTKLVITREYK